MQGPKLTIITQHEIWQNIMNMKAGVVSAANVFLNREVSNLLIAYIYSLASFFIAHPRLREI